MTFSQLHQCSTPARLSSFTIKSTKVRFTNTIVRKDKKKVKLLIFERGGNSPLFLICASCCYDVASVKSAAEFLKVLA